MLVSKLDIMIPIQHILLVLLCYFICLHGPENFMKVQFYKGPSPKWTFQQSHKPQYSASERQFLAEMMNV